MAPHYGDSVLLSVCLVYLLFCLFMKSCDGLIQYDRAELIHIRDNMPVSQSFVSDPFSSFPWKHPKHRLKKRGKRGGVMVRLRYRGHRLALPSLTLSNVRSLSNKKNELTALILSQRDLRDCSAICLTETWLHEYIPDSALQLDGFTFHRADRTSESLKQRGGGVCIYINQNWCVYIKTLSHNCSPDLKYLTVKCIPFYSPREISSVILCVVYITPSAAMTSATQELADHIFAMENSNPDSIILLLGDFNHVSMKKALPRYKPQIHTPTRLDKTLDQCYSSIPEVYQALIRAPIGESDHNTVLLVPKYRQKLKTTKPVKKRVRWYSPPAIDMLQDCFDVTDWSVFVHDDIDTFTDTVMSYINFCESVCIPIKTVISYSNNKPWLNKDVRRLCREKNSAFRCNDKALYRLL